MRWKVADCPALLHFKMPNKTSKALVLLSKHGTKSLLLFFKQKYHLLLGYGQMHCFSQLKAHCINLTLFLLPFLRWVKTPHCHLLLYWVMGTQCYQGDSCVSLDSPRLPWLLAELCPQCSLQHIPHLSLPLHVYKMF